MVCNLCKISNHAVDLKLLESNLMIEIIKLIKLYPFNNILHVQVLKVLTVIFNDRSSNILADQLMEDGFLVEFLYQESVEQDWTKSANKKKYRKSNMGFITEIGS